MIWVNLGSLSPIDTTTRGWFQFPIGHRNRTLASLLWEVHAISQSVISNAQWAPSATILYTTYNYMW